MSARTDQAGVREINRMLLESVGSDWSYPQSATATFDSSFVTEPIGYRERYYGTTDDEADEGEVDFELEIEDDDLMRESDEEDKNDRESAVLGLYLDRRLQARKRKRRKALEEEMTYNRGLCFFIRRRNAWTGAVSHESIKTMAEVKDTFLPSVGGSSDTPESSSRSKPADSAELPSLPPDSDSAAAPDASASPDTESEFSPPPNPETLTNVLIPLAPPIVPSSHPVRASILTRSDSELYEKIVRDTRTPAVPINLSQMMRVVVQGWKDEGNWPPRGTNMSSAGQMPLGPNGLGLGHDIRGTEIVTATGRKRVNKAVAVRSEVGSSNGARTEAQRGVLANHKHLRQGVDSVRRVLRLSGSGPPPGD
jgi:Protein of unknown function (DUF4050)